MVHPSYLSFFIALWFSLELQCMDTVNTEYEYPSNVKIRLSPGFITMTWDCNNTKALENNTYEIQYKNSHNKPLNISKCFYEEYIPNFMDAAIHKGLEVHIMVNKRNQITYTGVPEGKPNTAAENFSCIIYNVSIWNCSWTAGKEAPKDTQYSLVFRRGEEKNVSCRDYQLDSFGRQVGCELRTPDIDYVKKIYAELVGSSNKASIQFFDEIFKPNDKVILDPPKKITLDYTSDGLNVTWDLPETYIIGKKHFFKYSININGKVDDDLTRREYTTKNLHSKEKAMVLLRVRWASSSFSMNENWSTWSKLYEKELDSTGLNQSHLLIVLGLVTATGLLVAIFLCHRFQIWKRLFPKVPQPAMKFFDQAGEAGILDKNILEEEMLCKKVEDEECICLHIKEETPQELSEITKG